MNTATRQATSASRAHSVCVEGDALRSFNSRDAALTFARSKVYLSPERLPDMEALLDAGLVASWQYGFAGVDVYPGVP
jgi:hypothetical protein